MSETAPSFRIKIENNFPLDVLDFTGSLTAVADEYRRYSGEEGSRLVVERISEGSVIAQLGAVAKGVLVAGSPLLPIALETIAPFVGHFGALLEGLASYGRDAAKDADVRRADKASLRNASAFVEPAIHGNAINVQGDLNIGTLNLDISPERAGDIKRAVRHLLAPMPDESRFENEPLQIYQLRDAKAGDMGFIDRFDKRARRLTFANEEAKQMIVHAESPFDVFFFVSGLVKTAGGEVASYLIDRIDGITPKEAG